jgi:uncharacterized protein (TIGR02145 family)
MMKKLFTLLLAAACFTASAQTEYPYPWNPDGNNDGFVSMNDLLDLLAIFGSEYYSGVLATDSISAIMYTGELDYWDCTSSCVALTGNWKVLDHYLVGSYRNEILDAGAQGWWLDHKAFGNDGYAQFWRLANQGNPDVLFTEPSDPYVHYHCYCQTRTRGDIEDLNLCENELDECGVCGGDGAVYDCGCESIPEGDCDCDGNQVDAVGVCGGDCLEDLDGDGVCDPVLGPCEGEDFVSYHGVDYPIVETADGRCWFGSNLNATKYSTGDDVNEAETWAYWPRISILTPQHRQWICCIDYEGTYIDPNGYYFTVNGNGSELTGDFSHLVYNHRTIQSEANICPVGWHVPEKSEWQELQTAYGHEGSGIAELFPEDYISTNSCNFDAAPIPVYPYGSSGLDLRTDAYVDGYNGALGTGGSNVALFWTSTLLSNSDSEDSAYYVQISGCSQQYHFAYQTSQLTSGYAVRCIKD